VIWVESRSDWAIWSDSTGDSNGWNTVGNSANVNATTSKNSPIPAA
jgi:hypothetical protein